MHDILKERIWRRLEALPQEQVYQVLDYIEFLEARYAKEKSRQPDALQKFAERVEDSMRMRSVAPKVISGTVGLLGTARKVVKNVSDVGKDLLSPLQPTSRPPGVASDNGSTTGGSTAPGTDSTNEGSSSPQ